MGILTPNRIITSPSANGVFLARLNTAQSITSSTLVTAIFTDEVIDGRNQYNPATGVFTCSLPGYWQFNTYLRISSAAGMTNAFAQITHNGIGYRGQQTTDASSTTTNYVFGISTVILLAIGDTVQIQGFASASGAITYSVVGSVYPSVFSGYLVANF